MLNNEFDYLEDDLEDDWENIKIPDLIINYQETVKNKEREKRLLEERKMMEEADLALTNELFDETKKQINEKNDNQYIDRLNLDKIKIVKLTKEKPEELKMLQIKKRNELIEKQKLLSQKIREKKQQQQKFKELYGEAEVDIYTEMYGGIEDKY